MLTIINKLIREEEGVSAIEYGLIAGLIAVGIIGAVTTLSGKLTSTFDAVSAVLP